MNLRQIEVMRAFMLTGTVSGAAELLHISQPGVSKALKHIEDQLAVRLFRRVKGRLLPTAEAEQLFTTISEAWLQIERVGNLARNLGSGVPAILRVGTTPSLGASLIPSIVSVLMKRRKELRLSVELSAPNVLIESLFTRNIDVAVTLFPVAHPGLLVEKVTDSPLVCIMPKNHALARRTAVSLADMQPFPFVSFAPNTPEGRQIGDLFARAGFERNVAIEVRSSASACWFVKAGAGVAIVDFFAVFKEAFPGVVARPLRPSISFEMNICTHALAPTSDAMVAFANETRRQCQLAQKG
jgi:DNA-binding transcriptional LysR family regulator